MISGMSSCGKVLFVILDSYVAVYNAQSLALYGVAPSYSKMGKLNGKLGYNLNVASTINAFSQTVDGKFFPATHTHLVMQAILVHQINKKVSVSTGYAFGRHNIWATRK